MHFAVADTDAGPVAVAIVSDGVSSAPRPDEASWMAVNTGITLLAEGAQRGDDPAGGLQAGGQGGRAGAERAGRPGRGARRHLPVRHRQQAAGHRVLGRRQPRVLARGEPAPAAGPNDTIDITGGSRRVTRDDSLAEEIVAAGLASMDEAMASPQAHVITRWLGADLPDPEAHVEAVHPDRARRAAAVLRRAVELPPGGGRAGRHGDAAARSPARSTPPPTWPSSRSTPAASTTSRSSSSRSRRGRTPRPNRGRPRGRGVTAPPGEHLVSGPRSGQPGLPGLKCPR